MVVHLPRTGIVTRLPKRRIEASIDYAGAALLTVCIVALTLVASWGGGQYAWGSWQILALAAVSVAALVAFVLAERRASEPIIPPRLFRNRNFTVSQVLSFLVGAAMFGSVNFMPQYMQYVRGASSTASGLLLLPLMFSMLVVMLATGQITTRTGHYRSFPILGGLFMTAGMLVLLLLGVDTATLAASALTAVVGVGMGFLLQNTLLITQNSVEQRDLGAASGAVTLFRTVGGSLGIALLGSVYASRLQDTLAARLGAPGRALVAGGARIPRRSSTGCRRRSATPSTPRWSTACTPRSSAAR
jgi:predicted MFS family arabinose efflux permease